MSISKWRITNVSSNFLILFAEWQILPFDYRAADEFKSLRQQGVRLGTMDLKIASIVLVHGGTLLSGNNRDFQQVPGLQVEDWLPS